MPLIECFVDVEGITCMDVGGCLNMARRVLTTCCTKRHGTSSKGRSKTSHSRLWVQLAARHLDPIMTRTSRRLTQQGMGGQLRLPRWAHGALPPAHGIVSILEGTDSTLHPRVALEIVGAFKRCTLGPVQLGLQFCEVMGLRGSDDEQPTGRRGWAGPLAALIPFLPGPSPQALACDSRSCSDASHLHPTPLPKPHCMRKLSSYLLGGSDAEAACHNGCLERWRPQAQPLCESLLLP